jgi:hypothetical protein
MVRIKFTTRPRFPVVSPKFGSMASDEALKVSAEQRETSIEQLEGSLGGLADGRLGGGFFIA